MKTYPILGKDGTLLAFEITSTWLTFRPLLGILRSVAGVSGVRRQYFNDDRVVFNYFNEPFVVNESWGDNSRYWVGPLDTSRSTADVHHLQIAFQQHCGLLTQLCNRLIGRRSAA